MMQDQPRRFDPFLNASFVCRSHRRQGTTGRHIDLPCAGVLCFTYALAGYGVFAGLRIAGRS
jgi:hypothetical protein